MATLTVNGKQVQVDDSFLKLSPADQERTVDEIASHIGAAQPKPGSREYADWAVKQAVAGNSLPQVSPTPPAWQPQDVMPAWARAFSTHAVESVPLAGPVLHNMTNTPMFEAVNKQADQQAPAAAIAGDVFGTVAPLAAGGSFIPGAAKVLGMEGGLPMRMAAGGLSSMAIGGTDALLRGDDPRQAGVTAGIDAAAGALVPVAGHVVGKALGSAYENVAKAIAGRRAAAATGYDPAVAKVLQATMAADGSLGPQGAANMASAGNEAMLADAGPAAQQVLDTAIQKSGEAGALARSRIGGRVDRDAQAVGAALDSALGPAQGVQTLRGNIADSTAQARDLAYNAAYARPIDYASNEGRNLEGLLTRVRPADISAANAMMKEEGLSSKQILASIDNDGNVSFKTMPDVRQVDYLTRALNDRADATNAMGKLGGQTTAGRITQGLSRDIRDALKQAVPEYDIALDTAADPIRRSQAVKFGSQVLNAGTTADDVANEVAGMTGPERSAMAQGVRSQIDNAMGNVQRALTDPNVDAREAVQGLKTLSSRNNRAKVASIIGDGPAQQMFDELDRAAKSFELRAAVAGNTKTFTRTNMDRQIGELTNGDSPVDAVLRGEPVNAVKRVVQAITGRSAPAVQERQDTLYRGVVDALTRNGPAEAANLGALGSMSAAGQKAAASRRLVLEAILKGAAPGSVPMFENRAAGSPGRMLVQAQ